MSPTSILRNGRFPKCDYLRRNFCKFTTRDKIYRVIRNCKLINIRCCTRGKHLWSTMFPRWSLTHSVFGGGRGWNTRNRMVRGLAGLSPTGGSLDNSAVTDTPDCLAWLYKWNWIFSFSFFLSFFLFFSNTFFVTEKSLTMGKTFVWMKGKSKFKKRILLNHIFFFYFIIFFTM